MITFQKNQNLTSICALFLIALFSTTLTAQTTTVYTPNEDDTRVITTGAPFLLIATDARAAAMGDMGVATSVDAYSQQWNPSKYAFSEAKSGFSLSYTPYLSKLVNDIFLGNVTYFNRLNERSAFAVSLKYFSLGEIELREDEFSEPIIVKPNELTLDASYALRLSDQFSMAVASEIYSIRFKNSTILTLMPQLLGSFGVDIAGYYQSEEEAYNEL